MGSSLSPPPRNTPEMPLSCHLLAALTNGSHRQISQTANEPVMVFDQEMQVVLVNKAARRLTGCAQPWPGRRCWEILTPGPSTCAEYPDNCWIKKVLTTGQSQQITISRTFHSGETCRLLSASALYDEAAVVRHVVVLLRDVTGEEQYRRADKDLSGPCPLCENAPESTTRALLDSIGEGILFLDPRYRIINANKRLLEIGNYRIEEVVGKFCHEVSHNSSVPCWAIPGGDHHCPVKIALETGKAASAIHTHYGKKGEHLFVEVKAFPLLDAQGRVFQVIETHHDITEKKAIENRLRQAEKMESLGNMAGGIAHDLNNMLTPIMGISDLALATMAEDNPYRKDFQDIRAASERAAALVSQVLAFSRRQIINKTVLDLNQVINHLGKMLLRIIREDIILQTHLEQGLWRISGDQTQLEQIIINMVVNARDAMPAGGALRIETRNLDNLESLCHTCGEPLAGQWVLLQISDEGTGIAPEILPRIFEPFFTTKGNEHGTGMGLATSTGIVHQHEGHINVYSEPGRGAMFKIYLPRLPSGLPAEPASVPSREPASDPGGGAETILVVDDDDYVRGFMQRVLARYGYTVHTAENGRHALELFAQHQGEIDLVLTDVVMPGMGGRELMESIHTLAPQMLAVFMSGYTLDAIHRKFVLEKGIEFLQKPLSMKSLLSKIRALLDRKDHI